MPDSKQLLSIKVKPNSKKGQLIQPMPEGGLVVHVAESAVDGQANTAVIAALAKYFKVPKSQIQIIRGLNSRNKLVQIT